MDRTDGEIPIGEPDFAFVFFQQHRERCIVEAFAEWTLEIAEFDDGDRGIVGADCRIVFYADAETLIRVLSRWLLWLRGCHAVATAGKLRNSRCNGFLNSGSDDRCRFTGLRAHHPTRHVCA